MYVSAFAWARPTQSLMPFFIYFPVCRQNRHIGDFINLRQFGPCISHHNCVLFTPAWPTKVLSVFRRLDPFNVSLVDDNVHLLSWFFRGIVGPRKSNAYVSFFLSIFVGFWPTKHHVFSCSVLTLFFILFFKFFSLSFILFSTAFLFYFF